MRSFFLDDQQQSKGCVPSLSFKERLIGFAACVVLGYLIQILSFGSFLSLATGSPAKFAIFYSLGNIIALAGTGFLIGFWKQVECMIDQKRRITSIVFVSALAGTLICAIWLESRLLVFLFLLVQIPAYIWYCASYFPMAQDCIRNALGGIFGRFFNRSN